MHTGIETRETATGATAHHDYDAISHAARIMDATAHEASLLERLDHADSARFKLMGEIPVKSVCHVIKAVDISESKPIALKLVPTGREIDRVHAEREIKALSMLKGEEGIVPIHDFGVIEVDGEEEVFVATELQPSTLGQYIATTREDVSWLTGAMVPVLHGLQAVHDRGWVHRDVKPDNIFIDDEVKGMLGDFGLVTPAGELEEVTDPLVIRKVTEPNVGTIDYVPKEDLLGCPAESSRDMFAFGVTMYKCLTGRLPYGHAETALESFKAMHSAGEVPNPADVRPGVVSRSIGNVVVNLLGEPDKRHKASYVQDVFAEAA